MPQQIKNVEKRVKRRGNNEGSIYQRKDGRWCAQAMVGYTKDGKAKFKYTYGYSRQEVAKKLTKITNEVFENGYSSFAISDTKLLAPLLEDWYFTFKEPTITSRTSEKIRGYIKNHIKPGFDELTIDQIDLFRAQRFFNGLARKGLCLDTIKQIKQVLDQFYTQYLMKMQMVKENPFDGVKIKTKERKDIVQETMALTRELRSEIISRLENEPILRPILITLMLTGIRPGELIALRWKDVDLKNSIIHIRSAASIELSFDDNGDVVERKQFVSNTKTVLSTRSFAASESVMQCLIGWKAFQNERQLNTNIDFTSSDCYVFSTEKGTIRSYGGLRSMLIRFLKRNGLEDYGINLYTFRHTFATMLLEQRENPKIVSELMGHAKVLTTLSIYSHVISQAVYVDTAKTLDGIFKNLSEGNKKTDESNEDPSVQCPKTDRSFDSSVDNSSQF